MIEAFISQFGGAILAALAAVVGVIGAYLKGRSEGRWQEQLEQAERTHEQAQQARQEVQDVKRETAAMADSDLDQYLRDYWVRGKSTGKGGD